MKQGSIHKPADWHETQNNEYLDLVQKRLTLAPLIWVRQFLSIIEKYYSNNPCPKQIKVNDFGCNVGHFYYGCGNMKDRISYVGYDLSETYLFIANSRFYKKNYARFELLDISKIDAFNKISTADIAIISATLEHIEDFQTALKNIFISTEKLVIIRTFVGDISIKERCLSKNAKESYLIRQFTINDLVSIPKSLGWTYKIIKDQATRGLEKYVCNEQSIQRTQSILVFRK